MATLDFLATVVLLSASGVLGPGPLFLASTLRATKRGTIAGIECAVGHTLVEFPLVVGLAIGLQALLQSAADYVAIAGGVVLLVFASLQLFQATKKFEFDPAKAPGPWTERNGIVIGAAFTALNPFFIIWWATVGAILITEATVLGAFVGVMTMFAAHIWMDYAWLGGTAALVGRGGKLVLGKWYRALLVAFSLAMFYFGTSFILSAMV